MQSSIGDTSPLQILSNLLKSIRHPTKDPLGQKRTGFFLESSSILIFYTLDKFDKIATNEIEPKILKFSGFEIGKMCLIGYSMFISSHQTRYFLS